MKLRITKDKVLGLIFHPAFLAIPFFITVLVFSGISISPYKIDLQRAESEDLSGEKNIYIDINSDLKRERLRGYSLITNATVIAYTTEGGIYEAWNLSGRWVQGNPDFKIFDLDKNNIPEIYALTITPGDSLFINQMELRRRKGIQKTKFVSKLNRLNETLDHKIDVVGFYDISGDGTEDVVFYISAGFTLQPRAIFAWDVINDRIIRSNFCGINFKFNKQLLYFNDKNNLSSLLFLENYATDNYKTPIPFPDTASYAVVFTDNLQYLFEPVHCGGRQSNTITFPFLTKDGFRILAIVQHRRRTFNKIDFLLLDKEGNIIKSESSHLFDKFFDKRYFNGDVILIRDGKHGSELGTLNQQLEYIRRVAFKNYFYMGSKVDLDEDDKDELVLFSKEKNMIGILQDDLKSFSAIKVPAFDHNVFFSSLKRIGDNGPEIYIQTGNYVFDLIYAENNFYPFRFLLYALIYFSIFAFLFLLQKIFIFTNNRRRIREEKLLSYQLQSVMNQLNPHFTFNAINSIGYAIMEGRKEEAYDYFTKLSGLIRKSMKNAFRPYKTLGEEISFVEQYLEIEEYRFAGKLEWSLEVDPSVDLSVSVPKMLIHIFVENSIKHGIFHLEGKGRIDVNVSKNGVSTEIIIEDNGVGYMKTTSFSNSDGKGLIILNNYLGIYNSTMKNNIKYIIENKNRQEEKGARVRIWIE